ncbi:hypothetical protein HBI56_063380 [Parastagonospora nodorum]|nr:hypothetical protein HBH53_194490 [Parastagonospora nodorum]KAH3966165.1 hypothetical protein HBH52_201330 [Parastagonospora nodorum]KAH4002484.1 hypothetical protein HBI10_076260 [Parastagonospora nodorum]KAH4025962.1 hypothetical protein HBI13_072070 [Parastagonospora nodorum]KAH4036000.1 hypothetical protein HBI09_081460 [Parastagonospora nodorum]
MSLDQHTMVIQSNETGVRELMGPSVWGAVRGRSYQDAPGMRGTMAKLAGIEPPDSYLDQSEPQFHVVVREGSSGTMVT